MPPLSALATEPLAALAAKFLPPPLSRIASTSLHLYNRLRDKKACSPCLQDKDVSCASFILYCSTTDVLDQRRLQPMVSADLANTIFLRQRGPTPFITRSQRSRRRNSMKMSWLSRQSSRPVCLPSRSPDNDTASPHETIFPKTQLLCPTLEYSAHGILMQIRRLEMRWLQKRRAKGQ